MKLSIKPSQDHSNGDTMYKTLVAISVCAAFSGCSAMSIPVSNQSTASPWETRQAVETVRITKGIPEGAEVIGTVTANRCHRNSFDPKPGESALNIDLQLSAYASGAEGIGNITYSSKGLSALGQNCWKIFTAEGTAYNLD